MGGGVVIRLLKRYDFWMSVLAGLALLAVLLLGAGADSGVQEGADSDLAETDYSTYNTGDRGLKALYTLMESRGTRVTRWRRPVTLLGTQADRLVVWQPAELSDEDWTGLEEWVWDGGVLVLSLPPGGQPSRLIPGGSDMVVTDPTVLIEMEPAGVSPVVQGVGSLQARDGNWLRHLDANAGTAVHVVNSEGWPVVVSWGLGDGQVFLVADPTLLINGELIRKDNLTLAVNLLDPGPDGSLAFDEYHHGAEIGEDWWQTLRPQMRWTILQAVLAALLVMILAGARLGRPVELPEGISREASEFAHGLGNLLRESRANGWVLQRLGRSFRRELAEHLGAGPGAQPEDLGLLWERHTGQPSAPLVALLHRCEAGEVPGDRNLVQMLGQMAEYRRQLGRGRDA